MVCRHSDQCRYGSASSLCSGRPSTLPRRWLRFRPDLCRHWRRTIHELQHRRQVLVSRLARFCQYPCQSLTRTWTTGAPSGIMMLLQTVLAPMQLLFSVSLPFHRSRDCFRHCEVLTRRSHIAANRRLRSRRERRGLIFRQSRQTKVAAGPRPGQAKPLCCPSLESQSYRSMWRFQQRLQQRQQQQH